MNCRDQCDRTGGGGGQFIGGDHAAHIDNCTASRQGQIALDTGKEVAHPNVAAACGQQNIILIRVGLGGCMDSGYGPASDDGDGAVCGTHILQNNRIRFTDDHIPCPGNLGRDIVHHS